MKRGSFAIIICNFENSRFGLMLSIHEIDWKYNILHALYMGGSREGGRGSRTPLKNNKNTGFLRNTGPDPLKITKLPSQHAMLGHHRHASETPFNGVSLADR